MKSRPSAQAHRSARNRRAALMLAGSIATLLASHSARAASYFFDLNSTTSGYGVSNGGSYDWTAGTPWTTDSTGASAVAGIAWPGGSNLAGFIGAGASTSYTVTLGAGDSSTVTLQNLCLNSDGTSSTTPIGTGDVVIGGIGSTGTLSLNAANSIGTYNGTLTINSKYNLGANSTNFRGGTIIINGVISGSGTGTGVVALASGAFGLTSGTLTLAGNNTFTGGTSVASGYVLNLQHANALGSTTGTNSTANTVASGGSIEVANGVTINSGENVTINGAGQGGSLGALRAGAGGGTWAGGVSLGDTAVRIGALAAQTLTITGTIANGATGTGFNISGQSGSGVVIINPTTSNSYTGTTGIIRGILRLGKNDALPTGTTLDVDSVNTVSDAATFDMAGFSQTVAVLQDTATTNINGKITNSLSSSTSTLTVNQASATQYDSIIENGSGTVALIKSGVGSLTLTGANTYTGGTTIKNGSIIVAGNDDRLATTGSVVIGDAATSGKLILGTSSAARSQTLAGLTATGLGGAVTGGNASTSTLTLNISSGANTYVGTLGGGAANENNLALTKTGAGILKLNAPNTYNGTTTLTLGTIQIGVDSVGSVGSITSSAIGTGSLNLNAGTISSDSTTPRTILNAITYSTASTFGDATNNGKLTFSAGVNLGTAVKTMTINSDVQFDGVLTGTGGGITKAGTGTLLITNSNNYTGNVSVAAGLLSISNSNALGTGTKTFTLGGSSRRLELTNSITLGANISMNLQTNTNNGVISSSGTNEIQGAISLINGGASIGSDGSSTLTVSGNITANGGTAFNLYGTSLNNNIVSGVIADGSSTTTLTKNLAGTWLLSNANTFRGNTSVTGGILKLTNNLAIQNSPFDTSGAGTLDVTTINTPTFGGLTSASNFALPANVTSLTLNNTTGASLTFSGNLTGGTAMQLIKTGANSQVLSGTNNTYSGLTTVNAGELRIGNAGALNGTSGILVNSGNNGGLSLDSGVTAGSGKTITINGAGLGGFFGALSSNGGTNEWQGNVTIGSAGTRIGINSTAASQFTISGVIDSGVVVTGAYFRTQNNLCTIVLTNANTYLGDTTLVNGGGSVQLSGGANRLPTSTKLIFGSSNVSGILDLNGQNQEVAGLSVGQASGTFTNEVKSTAGTPNFTVNTAAASTYSGLLTGTLSLVKKGTDILTLSNASNNYTGKTTVQAGTLSISAGDAVATNAQQLGTNTDLDLGVASTSSGTLLYTGGIGNLAKNINALGNGLDTIQNGGTGLLTLSGNLTKAGTTLTLKGGSNGITVSGVIQGTNGVLHNSDMTYSGGTITLTNTNTYDGPTFIINGATVNANAASALPTLNGRSAVYIDKDVTETNSGTGASTLAMTVSQSIASLSGQSNSTVNLNANTLTIGTTSGTTTFAGAINGTNGSIIKDGASTQVLSGSNGYTGATTINAGTLQAGAAAGGQAFGNGSAVTLANTAGAVLDLNGFNQTIGSLAGGGATGGNVALGSGTLTAGGDNTSTTFAGVISGNINSGLTKQGSGTLTLQGLNTYTGTTTVNAGTLLLVHNGGTGAIADSGAVVVNTGGTLHPNHDETIGSLGGSGGNVLLNNQHLTTGGNGGTTDFGGAISGNNTSLLTKEGSGTMTFSGASTQFNGNTVVNAGTLEVTGSLSGTQNVAVTVNTGGTLLLNSSTNADNVINTGTNLAVTNGSTVKVGDNQSNTLHTFNSLSLSGTANILDFGTGAAGNTLLFTANNAVTFSGTLQIWNWSPHNYVLGSGSDNGSLADNQDRLLFDFSQTLTSGQLSNIQFYSDNGLNPIGFGSAQVSFGTQFEIVPVPEPATTALIGAVALCGLIGYRERKRFRGTLRSEN